MRKNDIGLDKSSSGQFENGMYFLFVKVRNFNYNIRKRIVFSSIESYLHSVEVYSLWYATGINIKTITL